MWARAGQRAGARRGWSDAPRAGPGRNLSALAGAPGPPLRVVAMVLAPVLTAAALAPPLLARLAIDRGIPHDT